MTVLHAAAIGETLSFLGYPPVLYISEENRRVNQQGNETANTGRGKLLCQCFVFPWKHYIINVISHWLIISSSVSARDSNDGSIFLPLSSISAFAEWSQWRTQISLKSLKRID